MLYPLSQGAALPMASLSGESYGGGLLVYVGTAVAHFRCWRVERRLN